jgi:hypothetical protein
VTLQWIPLDALAPHPENCNRMPRRLLGKLKAHIQRTGLYEPLVVRPLTARAGPARADAPAHLTDGDATAHRPDAGPPADRADGGTPARSARADAPAPYQILNGHHRAMVLRELGHTHARCDVWEVDDAEARVLLATLNRLEGRDDPAARGRLVAGLADGRSAEELARLLPEPPDAVGRLLALAKPPPAPAAPGEVEALPRPLTFFLTEEQHETVIEALQEAAAPTARRCSRAEALERLALWYLEATNRR